MPRRKGRGKDGHFAFIGGGNIAEALIRGLLRAGFITPSEIGVSDILPERLEHLRKTYRVVAYPENARAAKGARVIILAVKPKDMAEALRSLAGVVEDNQVVITIAAGIPIRFVEEGLGGRGRVVRVMPNTPALIGKGAAGVAQGRKASKKDLELAVDIFNSVGRALVVEERLMDAVTGLSGSGPAFVAVVVEALADGGVKMGLPREVALALAAQTVAGTAQMVLETGEHPGRIKDMVASPGGTTMAGLAALEAGSLRSTLMGAVEAATRRSQELGRGE
jgi:pyrroline-5-carboxylate reductase